MSANYNRPRQRARTLGIGILSGNALSQEGVMNQIQENINFRIESAQSMLGSGSQAADVGPVERRQQIMKNRRSLLNAGDGMLGGLLGSDKESETSSEGRIGKTRRGTSGSIGSTGTANGTNQSTTQSSTPSMSDVNAGTKARAEDRGFGT